VGLQSENDVLSIGYQVNVCPGGVKLANIPRRLVITWVRKIAQLGGALPGYAGLVTGLIR
jgi:hypothetical protein